MFLIACASGNTTFCRMTISRIWKNVVELAGCVFNIPTYIFSLKIFWHPLLNRVAVMAQLYNSSDRNKLKKLLRPRVCSPTWPNIKYILLAGVTRYCPDHYIKVSNHICRWTKKYLGEGKGGKLGEPCGLYYKTITIVNDDCKWRHNLEHHLWS